MKMEFILGHDIEYYFYDDEDREMNEIDIEHVGKLLAEGYVQGELCQYDRDKDLDYRGWWVKVD